MDIVAKQQNRIKQMEKEIEQLNDRLARQRLWNDIWKKKSWAYRIEKAEIIVAASDLISSVIDQIATLRQSVWEETEVTRAGDVILGINTEEESVTAAALKAARLLEAALVPAIAACSREFRVPEDEAKTKPNHLHVVPKQELWN